MGVWDKNGKARGAADWTAGAMGGADIRGVKLAEHCNHAVGVCNHEDEAGGAADGAAGASGRRISGEYNSQEVANTLWAYATTGI